MALYRFNFGSADKSLFESGGSADFSLYSRSGVADSGGAKTKFAGIRVTGSSFLGDAAGDTTTICGNLVVTGNTTTINSTTLQVDDKNIELGTVDTPTDTTADGGGITLKGATDKTILWTNSTDAWHFNQTVRIGTSSSGHATPQTYDDDLIVVQ